jgi:hypothetical protein
VNAEGYRLPLTRQVGNPQWSLLPFDTRSGHVNYITHRFLRSGLN